MLSSCSCAQPVGNRSHWGIPKGIPPTFQEAEINHSDILELQQCSTEDWIFSGSELASIMNTWIPTKNPIKNHFVVPSALPLLWNITTNQNQFLLASCSTNTWSAAAIRSQNTGDSLTTILKLTSPPEIIIAIWKKKILVLLNPNCVAAILRRRRASALIFRRYLEYSNHSSPAVSEDTGPELHDILSQSKKIQGIFLREWECICYYKCTVISAHKTWSSLSHSAPAAAQSHFWGSPESERLRYCKVPAP